MVFSQRSRVERRKNQNCCYAPDPKIPNDDSFPGKNVESMKLLGVHFNVKMSWDDHATAIWTANQQQLWNSAQAKTTSTWFTTPSSFKNFRGISTDTRCYWHRGLPTDFVKCSRVYQDSREHISVVFICQDIHVTVSVVSKDGFAKKIGMIILFVEDEKLKINRFYKSSSLKFNKRWIGE